jgi:hypothetical protein
LRLLEVGSGSGGIAWFLRGEGLMICQLDSSLDVLQMRDTGQARKVCSSGTVLPFRDQAFDVVVSLDTLEHIPRSERHNFVAELKRVSRSRILLCCPADSSDNVYEAARWDQRLRDGLALRGQRIPEWLDDHRDKGYPRVEELFSLFPGAEVWAVGQGPAWVRSEKAYLQPFGWIFAGFSYWRNLKRDGDPGSNYRAAVDWRGPGAADEYADRRRPR